ncbi:hypothetical protein NP233_g11895 [Leucocoprinus birnbaumii]|uniref:F-box domain-containing protein n=1 Tax=Leucocoprinus birnbaumii TaxID=56174 RepID=A0AAD5VLB9_9AGAR|nr:hypothetical protein NP233_g11895 [Leucocoprinus birnbaumii]
MSLPNETLSMIFELVCTPRHVTQRDLPQNPQESTVEETIENRFSHFVLSAVSSRWRAVVHGMPQLWSFVELSVGSMNMRTRSEILNWSWSLTRNLSPLGLALRFAPRLQYIMPRSTLLTPAIDHLEAISLKLDAGPNLNLLDTINLKLPEGAPLQKITLSLRLGMNLVVSKAPWSTITSLNLVYVRIGVALRIIRDLSNLVRFRLDNAIADNDDDSQDLVTLTAPVSLPKRLEVYEISTAHAGWCNALARHVFFSSELKEIRWYYLSRRMAMDTLNADSMQAFFSRLPLTVKVVNLSSGINLRSVRENPNIEELSILIGSVGDLDLILQHLRPREDPGGQLVVKTFIGVKKFILRQKPGIVVVPYTILPPKLRQGYSILLFRALKARFESGERVFCLETQHFVFDWPLEMKMGLRKLIKDGYRLKIVENKEPVSWLL